MPHYHNNILVVTQKELLPFYSSEQYIRRKLSDVKKCSNIRIIQHGGGLGRQSLIEFNSLPERIKKALKPETDVCILSQYFHIDLTAQKFFYDEFKFDNGTSLKDKDKELYTTNASVLNAVLKLKTERENIVFSLSKKKPKHLWKNLLKDTFDFRDQLFANYKRIFDLPQNVRAFERIVKKYQAEGYKSLISGKYLNQNSRKVTSDIISLLNAMFVSQTYKPSPLQIAEQYMAFLCGSLHIINKDSGELYNPKDFSVLTERSITEYLSKWDNKIVTHQIRTNDRQKLISKYKPFHSMELPKFAGSLFSIDDRQPPFEYESGKRVWFYNGVDVASGCITTWVYGRDKKGIILEFYRQMIRNYYEWGINLPFELECESNLNSEFKETLLKEGTMFQSVRIEANNARGKYIERINEMLRYDYEKEYDGWIARPNAKRESNSSDNKPKQVAFDYIVNVGLECIQKYNNSPCPQNNSVSRFEWFLNNQHKDLPETNYPLVIKQLGYKTKTSCKVGRVALNGNKMLLGEKGQICTGKNLINKMRLAEGESLDVYWLDNNNGDVMKAYAYIGDKMICELLPEPCYNRATLEQTQDDKEKRALMSAYVMTIEAFTNRKKKEIDKVVVIDNRKKTAGDTFKIKKLHDEYMIEDALDIPNINFDMTEEEINEIELLPESDNETMFNHNLIGIETPIKRELFGGKF
jgi:hypothetical protein